MLGVRLASKTRYSNFKNENICLIFHSNTRSSVQSSLGSNGWDSCDNEAQFILMMQAYGQSFMESDINLFRMNLTALESLNHKYKLYHRV